MILVKEAKWKWQSLAANSSWQKTEGAGEQILLFSHKHMLNKH